MVKSAKSRKIFSAFRSPLGRVHLYSFMGGELIESHEPGPSADTAWEEIKRNPPCEVKENWAWLDGEKTPEGDVGMTENTMIETPTTEKTEKKSRKKREKVGDWTVVEKKFLIPGTEIETTCELWHVEYDGKTIEVPHDRDGQRQANDWIRRIKIGKSAALILDRIRRSLEEMTNDDCLDVETHARAEAALTQLNTRF